MATLTRISLGRLQTPQEDHRISVTKPRIRLNPTAPADRPKFSLGNFWPSMSAGRACLTNRSHGSHPDFFWAASAYTTVIWARNGRGVAQLLITIFVLFIGPLTSSIWAIVEGAQILGSHPGSPCRMDRKGLQLQD